MGFSGAPGSGTLKGSGQVFLPAPNGVDDTQAFVNALAGLPKATIFANANGTGASAVVPVGTLFLASAPATNPYKLGVTSDIGNLGPMVNILGPGKNACQINYYGAGDCIRISNPVPPGGDTLDNLTIWQGGVNGFTIDGTNALAGACGLHYGDTEGGNLGPDLFIRNFPQGTLATVPVLSLGSTGGSGGTFAAGTYFWGVTAVNRSGETVGSAQVNATLVLNGTQQLNWTAVTGATGYRIYRGPNAGILNTYVAQVGAVLTYTDTGTSLYVSCPPQVNTSGNIGLHLDNTTAWTENIWARVTIRNCGNCVVMTGANGVSDVSFEYNDLTLKVEGLAPNQNGVVIRNGAYYHNGSLKVRGNFVDGPVVQTSAMIALVGAFNGGYSLIGDCRLDVVGEINTPSSGGGANGLQTISFSDPNHNLLQGCSGVLSWLNIGANWIASNYSSSGVKNNFIFDGIIQGDASLSGANSPNATTAGAVVLGSGGATTAFQPLAAGDAFFFTLTASITLVLASGSVPCVAGPQDKVFVITQAAGGGFTVTWPKPGGPTLAAPAIYWPGGVAPVMSAGANAVDTYRLITTDGIHWYGSAFQANS